jgi:hypothetical protein
MNIICDKLNKIFLESKQIHDEMNEKFTRKSKISFNNVLEYIFKYSKNNTTKRDIMSTLKVYGHRTSYDRRFKNISVDFFKNFFLKIQKLYDDEINSNEELKNIVKITNENFNELNIYDNNNDNDNDSSNNNDHDIINNKYKIIAYDGTTNNRIQKGLLNTDQNLIGYDVNYGIPMTLNNNNNLKYNNKNNKSNKNSEITMFINYINKNPEKCKNTIFLGDRLYSVYELFDVIDKNKGKYIFRLKENLEIIEDKIIEDEIIENEIIENEIIENEIIEDEIIEDEIIEDEIIEDEIIEDEIIEDEIIECKILKKNHKNDKNYQIKCAIKNNSNIKILKYTKEVIKKITSKTNETKLYKIKSSFYLITNLGGHADYSKQLIQNIYNSRWNIEVHNKYLKNNFKFEKFYLKYDKEIEKIKYIDLIISTIIKILINFCLYEKQKNNENLLNNIIKKNFNKLIPKCDKRTKIYKDFKKNFKETAIVSVRINFTLFTTKFYEKIINELVYGQLKLETMIDIMNKDIEVIKNEIDRSFERKSIVPFTKWYVKMYHKKYEYDKIIDAIQNDKLNDLNKNLRCKAKSFMTALIIYPKH